MVRLALAIEVILLQLFFMICCVSSESMEAVLTILPPSQFIDHQVIYNNNNTAALYVSHRMDCSMSTCPCDVFSINTTTGAVFITKSLNFSDSSTAVKCTGSNGGNYHAILDSFQCFIIRTSLESSDSILLVIHIVPDYQIHSISDKPNILTAAILSTGEESTIVHYNRTMYQSIVTTLSPDNSASLDYTLVTDTNYPFTIQRQALHCTSVMVLLYTSSTEQMEETFYNLTVLISSVPSYPHPTVTTPVSVLIDVSYVNYYTPVLVMNNITVTIPSDTPRLSIITTLTASDADGGNVPAGVLRYVLKHHDGTVFGVNAVTGDLILLQNGVSVEGVYNVTVFVYDQGLPQYRSTESTVTIFIESFGMAITTCINMTDAFSVGELTPPDTDVFTTLWVEDKDSTNISTSLVCGTCIDCFQLTSYSNNNGQYSIMLTKQLNYELIPSYSCSVNVFNGMFSLLAVKEFTINVIDVNEPPTFEQSNYSISISELSPVNTVLLPVKALDEDNGDQVLYSISDNVQNKFAINSQTGLIYTKGTLSSIGSAAVLNISANDGEFEVFTTVTITITPGDKTPPTFTAPTYQGTVYENVSEVEPIFTFVAHDSDRGCPGAIEYTIVQAEPPYFVIDSTSGLLYVSSYGILSSEPLGFAMVTVKATSLGLYKDQFSIATLNLTILDSYNYSVPAITDDMMPMFSTSTYTAYLSEGTDTGTAVLTVTASSQSTIVYSLSVSNQFSIDTSTGTISVSGVIDRESLDNDTISLTVTATDSSNGQSSTAVVNIIITDVNDYRPNFMNSGGPVSVIMAESTPENTVIYTAQATDLDYGLNAHVHYTMDTINDHFYIHSTTGDLVLYRPVDYESDPVNLDLVITAADAGVTPLFSSLTISVTVTNVNDNYPLFTGSVYSCHVNEGANTNAVLLSPDTTCTVNATDIDTDSTITYSIEEDSSSTTIFTIDPTTGTITLTDEGISTIDHDTIPYYIVTVIARDDGNLSTTAQVIIDVIDYNDEAPLFDHLVTSVWVPSGLPVGTMLFTSHATDGDATDQLVGLNYNLLTSTESFNIDHDMGMVILDRELTHGSRYDIMIYVSDEEGTGTTSDTITVQVLTTNTNPSPPWFPYNNQLIIEVVSTSAVGTIVYHLNASDDSTILEYYITSRTYFSIDKDNGTLFVSEPLTTIVDQQITLELLVMDTGSPPLYSVFNLTVLIVSDPTNPPVFTNAQYNMIVSEAKSGDTSYILGHVLALVNGAYNDNVLYYITSYHGDLPFGVNNLTGAVYVNGPLDRETVSEYSFTVQSRLHGATATSMESLVAVTISDINDIRPQFVPSYSTVTLPYTYTNGDEVFRVFAVDKDNGINADTTFIISPSNDIISINGSTGVVSVQATPSPGTHNYTVTVSDSEFTRDLDMMIVITDQLSQLGDVICGNNSVMVTEDTPIGTVIYTMSIGGSSVFYKLVNDPYFTIHPSTGEVFVTTPIDKESHDHYNVPIIIWDGLSVNTTTCMLTVGVVNVNEHSPVFTSSAYQFTVSENSTINTTVGVVSAFDLDDGPSDIAFKIESSTGDMFDIDLISGRVYLNVSKQHLPHDISMIVSATDEGNRQSFVGVAIEITDVNDQIPLLPLLLPNITISENVPVGTHVLSVSALDKDRDPSTSYVLTNQDSTPFDINSTTGVITTSGPIDYETDSAHYQLHVTAVDNANHLFNDTTILHVSIYNTIDTVPEMTTDNIVTIQENMPPGTFILSEAAEVGVAPPHPITYTILNDQGLVYIETFTGTLRTLVPLDYEEKQVHNITIMGAYSDQYYTVVNVTILVEDDNDHGPQTTVDGGFMVSEGASVSDEVIFDIGYFDRDAGSNGVIKFVHILDPECNGVFSIDKTGKTTLKQTIDREIKDWYYCEVFVADNGSPPLHLSHHITVSVKDINDNPPSFDNNREPFSFVISVPVIVGEELFQVTATDEDENATITYYLINGTDTFTVDPSNGVFSIHDNLNLSQHYTLLLQATDEGGLNTTTLISVQLRHCGFHNLTYQPSWYSVTVPEDTPPGTLLLAPVINDFDTPGHFHHYLITDYMYINVNSTTGEVYLQQEFDYEQTKTIQVLLQVKDISEPVRIAEAVVTIIIADVNDNRPAFINTPYAVFMRDDTQVGTVIYTVEATDADSMDTTVQYDMDTVSSMSHGTVFTINTTTGAVTLYQYNGDTAHGERLQLVLIASDSGGLSSNVTLVVTVLSANAPVFAEPIYVSNIPESTPSGSVINNIQGLASNVSMAQLFYSIIDPLQDLKFPFSIHPYNGNLSINDRGIDYESKSFYEFFVRAEDTILGVSTQVEVLVYIEDINDNAPVFSQPLYTFTVSENTPINTVIGNVSASDEDTPPYSQIMFSLSSTNFIVEPFNGVVHTNVLLDYEVQQSHQFVVIANDRGVPIALEGSASVRVIVTNLNDNPPVFSLTNQIPLVPEYPPKNHFITLVSGSDPDNDDIFYDLAISEGSSNFIISDDGRLQVRSNITILPDPSYNVTVIANDGLHTVNQTITIDILDINDHSPVFVQDIYYANVTEGSPQGVYVTTVTATDNDRGVNAEIRYSGNLVQFLVNSETGIITTSETEIDRETSEEYQLLVIGRDGGDRTGTTMVVIQVLDINDNVPQFSQTIYTVFVTEGSEIGTVVLTVSATDPDEGSNGTVTYAINGTVPVPFYINNMTGVVTVFGTLDYETQPVWNITVLATDGGGLQSAPAVVNVNLRNQADANPQFSKQKYEIEFEECPSGCASVYVSMVNVTYPDSCVSSSITIYESSSSSLPFTIESTTGIIRAVGNIKRINDDSFTFTVLARCTVLNDIILDDLFATALVQINITDTNEPPSVTLLTVLTISEGVPINSTVGVVTGTDNDLGDNGTLVYSVIESHGAVPFKIDSESGEIKTSGVLDRETSDEHRFTVGVSDKGSPSLSAPYGGLVIVTIEDVNDSPPVIAVCVNETECGFEAMLAEGTSPGTPVLTLSIDDPDTINDISFIVSTTVFRFESVVNEDNAIIGGVISTVQELDRETLDWYEFEAIVSDGIHTASILISINITDINDQVPVFEESDYQVTINENYPPFEVALEIFATDDDIGSNAVVLYRLLSTPQLNNLTINSTTGQIYFLEPPDYEVSTRIDLLAQAYDLGGLQSDTVSIVINILDLNDNAPEFSADNYTYSILENSLYGSDIGYVSATDSDSGVNGLVTYHLMNDSNYFQVNLVNGLITSKQPLDRESLDIHQFIILARDNAVNDSQSASVSVSIIVLDDNDNAPVFEGTSEGVHVVMVSEQADINEVVLTLNTSDSDLRLNAQLSFYLTGEGSDDFTLSTNGSRVVVSVAKPLNHEGTARYDLTLGAIDGGIPSLDTKLNLTILVSDENDNVPMFVRQYETTVHEDIAVGTVIVTVEAFDLDSSDHSLIYSIKEEQDMFVIDSSNGSVYINRSLDYETHQQHILTAIASEDNDNPQTAETTITINILDVNDNPPVFICEGEPCPVHVLHVTESQPFPVIVYNYSVMDEDTVSDPDNMSYSIVQHGGDDDGSVFTIHPLSGVLTVHKSLDREVVDVYQLVIAASDNGVPPLSGYCNVTLIVDDVNDNPPEGGQQTIYIYLNNGEIGVTEFGRVYFNDKDIVNNYEFTYRESPPPAIDWITISTDGTLQSQEPRPLINHGLYQMQINITDTLYNGTVTYTVTMVTVEVRNVTVDVMSNSISMIVTDGGDSNNALTRFINGNLISLKETIHSYLRSAIAGIEELLVYSITNMPEQNGGIELQISAKLDNGTYLDKDLLLYYLFVNRALIEGSTQLGVVTEDIDYCSLEPCGRDGLCVVNEYHHLYNTAINKGTAVVYVGLETYHLVTCDCYDGKTGKTCSENELRCSEIDCGGNGECVEFLQGDDVISGCQCNHGYIDESCDIPLESHDNLCQPDPCQNGGTCTYSHIGFTCTCQTGFTGQTCSELAVDHDVICGDNPCLHGGQCSNTSSTHHCSCPEGYIGRECQVFVYGDPCPMECEGCIYSHNRVHCVPPQPTTCISTMCSGNQSCPLDRTSTMCVDECLPNPCLNGGECVRMFPGYHCMCPSGRGLNGPLCEVSGITLTSSDSRVLLPSFERLSAGEISLELSTRDTGNGTVLFISGTDSNINDHIVITIEHGYVHFRVSRGNGSPSGSTDHYVFEEFQVNDGEWYTLLLQYDINAINMSVIKYSTPYRHQKINTPSIYNYYFDTTLPVIVGNPPSLAGNGSINVPTSGSVIGCIRDLTINGLLMDFSSALLEENGVSDGCGFRDCASSDVCENGGVCVSEYDSGFECVCQPVHSGTTCSQVTSSIHFDGNLYIQYMIVSKGLTKRQVTKHSYGSTSITVSFSTVTSDGVLIQLGRDNSSDHIILKVDNNYLGMSMSLNNGVHVTESLISTVTVSNGHTHNITFTRKGKTYELTLDNMYSVRGVVSGEDEVLNVNNGDIYVGSDPQLIHGYKGCIHGMKLDNKDIPLMNSNEYFIATPSDSGAVKSCDQTTPTSPGIWAVFDTLYILGGVALGVLVVIVIVFVLVSRSSHYCYNKRRDKLEVEGRRDPIFSPVNPIAINRTSLRRSLRSGRSLREVEFLQRTNSFEHFAVSDSSTSDISHTHRPSPSPPVQSPLPVPSSTIERDTSSPLGDHHPLINDPPSRLTPVKVTIPKMPTVRPHVSQDPIPSHVSQDPKPSHVSQDPMPSHVSQNLKPTRISQDPVPTRISQDPVPSRVSQDPKLSHTNLDPKMTSASLNPKPPSVRLDPMTGMPLQELKRNETTSSVVSPTDARNYIMEKVEETNKEVLATISYDDMRVYNDEGDYVSLGSLESLYEILDHNKNKDEFEITKMELERQLEAIECTPKSTKHTPLVTSPLMKRFTTSPLKHQPSDKSYKPPVASKPHVTNKLSKPPPVASKPVKVAPKVLKRTVQSKKMQPTEKLQLTEQLKDRTNRQWSQQHPVNKPPSMTTTAGYYAAESEML